MKAVTRHGELLQYASPFLQNDSEVVYQATCNNPHAMSYASDRLRWDKRIIMTALSLGGMNVCYLLYNRISMMDDETSYQAVCSWGGYLKYLNNDKKSDERYVMQAVSTFGDAIEFVDKSLLFNKPEIVHKALQTSGESIKFLPIEMRDNEELAKVAIMQDPAAFRYISERLQGSYEFAKLAIEKDASLLEHTCTEICSNKSIVISAVTNHGSMIKCASTELQDDEELAYIAILNDPSSFKYLSKRLRDDDDLVYIAVQLKGYNLVYANFRLRNDVVLFQIALNNGLQPRDLYPTMFSGEILELVQQHCLLNRKRREFIRNI